MIQVPVRGIWSLQRALLMIVVTTAVPYVIKKSKPLAKVVGDKCVEFGEWLKSDSGAAVAESQPAQAPAETEPASPHAEEAKKKAPSKPKTTPSSGATKKATPRSKPKTDD